MIYNYVNTRVFRKSTQKAQKLSRRQVKQQVAIISPPPKEKYQSVASLP